MPPLPPPSSMFRAIPSLRTGARQALPRHTQPCRLAAQRRTFVASAHRAVQQTGRAHAIEAASPSSSAAASSGAVPPRGSQTTASGESTSTGPATPAVKADERSRSVLVTWASGVTSRYHNIWLRDHCRCSECYHPKTKQRLLNTFEIPADVQPRQVESTTEGLLVHWPPLSSALVSSSSHPASPSSSSAASIDAATAASSSSSSSAAGGPPSTPTRVGDHASLYPWRWLMHNSYSPVFSDSVSAALDEGSATSIEKVLWGKGIGSSPPTVRYDDVMASDEGVLKWLTKVAQYGFCFVQGVPPTPEDTEALVRRIAFIRETHYGGFWDFTSDLSHGDTAYTDLALQAHTDTTYFTDPAGLQLFHLLSHTASKSLSAAAGSSSSSSPSSSSSSSASSSSAGGGSASTSGPSGGESLLVDGFLAAEVLRDVHPDAYDVLSRVRVRTHSAGDEGILIRPLFESGYPILEHDDRGALVRVRYNNDDRSVLRIDEADVEAFYDALRKWDAILRNDEGEFWQQLKPGTALIFDNHRVLHGRSAFVGNRRLCGAYINHDDYRSRLAVLHAQYAAKRSVRGVWDDGL
ncbi:uncharacterized protein PFL1_00677 [Pseudozyma flocculosa PF-1]|uniref:trimethyllysine dioxygenase n=1 Tax=Pseudozyma flocculosa TaxID=84751 RepID=A0A5C3FD73_9BASI|nr:uncharacterized protein PFL1_00677 [Pseudozyma flocculosa PF-1]EPQ32483.1 hypothetical protein PFL1_00677 [Pseudozyma flocculosa PF-1]SPO42308.1 related to trimethyllysine hydroxylase [Pseudozyma flocculosa]